jgi:hypothetical protein
VARFVADLDRSVRFSTDVFDIDLISPRTAHDEVE